MKDWVRCVCCLVICATSLTVKAEKQALNYLLIDKGTEPYQYVSGSRAAGLITDIIEEVSNDIGVDLHTKIYPSIANRQEDVTTDKVQNWIYFGSPYWYDEDFLKTVEFSEIRIFTHSFHVVSLTNGEVPRYQNKSSFSQHSVVLIEGYRYGDFSQYVREYGDVANIHEIRVPGHQMAFSELINQRADYYIVHKPRAMYFLKEENMLREQFHFVPFTDVPPRQVFLMYDKRLPADVKQKLNEGLKRLKRSGRLNGILAKYH